MLSFKSDTRLEFGATSTLRLPSVSHGWTWPSIHTLMLRKGQGKNCAKHYNALNLALMPGHWQKKHFRNSLLHHTRFKRGGIWSQLGFKMGGNAPSQCKSFQTNLNCFLIVPIYPTDWSLFQFGIITNRSRRKWTKRSLPLHSSPEQMSEQILGFFWRMELFEFSVTFRKRNCLFSWFASVFVIVGLQTGVWSARQSDSAPRTMRGARQQNCRCCCCMCNAWL